MRAERRQNNIRMDYIGFFKKALLYLIVLQISVLGFGISYVLGMDLKDKLDPSKIYDVDMSAVIYDNRDNKISSIYGTENRTWVSIQDIPQNVRYAFVAAEDARFYSHSGVDIVRIFGAFWEDIKTGALEQGASTITQQLIKNTHLTREKTFSRKIEEALLALELERRYSKDEILEMYLNYNYFGAGAYGIQAAAQTYFSKNAAELTLYEAASIAAILKSSVYYAPHLHLENNKSRRDIILTLMADYGFISSEESESAKTYDLVLNMNTNALKHGWYIDAAASEAANLLGISVDELIKGGYKIYTEMDESIQQLCEDAFDQTQLFPDNNQDGTVPQAALVIIDSKTKGVRAIIGGRSYNTRRGYDRAQSLRRQPGSAIKPVLVYAPALHSAKFLPASMFDDSPKSFGNYTPSNYKDLYYGEVTMRQAITDSLNIPAVEILNTVGLDYAKEYAESMGIVFDESDNGLALALGGFKNGVSPLMLCTGYATIASGGEYQQERFIRKIESWNGELLYQAQQQPTRVMSEDTAFILTDMLNDVITDGTGKRLYMQDIPLAGKTGTNGYNGIGNRDAWIAAYNIDYSAVVWMGYDTTDDEHYLPSACSGGSYPALLLKYVFQGIYKDTQAPDFICPVTVQKIKLNKASLEQGKIKEAADYALPDDYIEDYVPGYVAKAMVPVLDVNCAVYDFAIESDYQGKPVITFIPSSSVASYAIMRSNGLGKADQIGLIHSANKAYWTDETAAFGSLYAYYIQPLDPVTGQLKGNPTKKILYIPVNH